MIDHQAEILSRPKRTWFESEKEKQIAKKSGRVELNGPEAAGAKKGKKGKLSGKDKKRLDDSRERSEGKVWKKGKGERMGGGGGIGARGTGRGGRIAGGGRAKGKGRGGRR